MKNACWSSAFWKIRNHKLSFNNFLYILIRGLRFLIEFNNMVPDFSKSWTSARIFQNWGTNFDKSEILLVVFAILEINFLKSFYWARARHFFSSDGGNKNLIIWAKENKAVFKMFHSKPVSYSDIPYKMSFKFGCVRNIFPGVWLSPQLV